MIICICPHCRREIDIDGDKFMLMGKRVKCESCGKESPYEATVMSSVKFKDKHGDKSVRELMDEAIDDAVLIGSILFPMPVFDAMTRTALFPEKISTKVVEQAVKKVASAAVSEMMAQLQTMLRQEFGSKDADDAPKPEEAN